MRKRRQIELAAALLFSHFDPYFSATYVVNAKWKNWTFNAEKPPKKAVFLKKVVRVTGFEPRGSCSQTYVWTFSKTCCALFGAFRHSCGSSLELYWPVYFSHRFRLLGFVWDWILYIKSASDRVYIQQRVLFAAESSSETAPHKQRNKRWRDITHPLDKRKMCCGR